jgi:hypothetical protein
VRLTSAPIHWYIFWTTLTLTLSQDPRTGSAVKRGPRVNGYSLARLGRLRTPPCDSSNSQILRFLVNKNPTTTKIRTIMASTTTGSISDAPLTDELMALSEVQRADDFRSTTTSRSTSSALSRSDQNIDWTRLYGYIVTPRLAERPKSFIWLHGYKIKDMRTNLEYWLCKICHKQQPYA